MQNIAIYAAMIFSGARYGQNLADMGSAYTFLEV